MTSKALHVLIGGMVQGVGFRQATVREARKLGLNGWVRNLSDGRVEAWFEGPDASRDAIREWCKSGPALAEVRSVEASDESATGTYVSFEILF